MSTLDSIREEIRDIIDLEYARIEWRAPFHESLGELPAIPDYLVPAIIRKLFGKEVGAWDPVKDETMINPEVENRITELVAEVVSYVQQAVARGVRDQSLLPVIEQEAASAASLQHTTSMRPNFEELSEQQAAAASLFQALQFVNHWITMVVIQRAREIRMEERTRG